MRDYLRSAYSDENLRRAWKWTRTGSNAQFKNYFRHIYRTYSLSHEARLRDLRSRLVSHTYFRSPAMKVYVPKKSGILRPLTLLCVEDQIVYQSLVNIVATKLVPRVRHRYYRAVFGHLYGGIRSTFFYARWRNCYDALKTELQKSLNLGFNIAASFDLTAFYDSLDHSVLDFFLKDLGLNRRFINELRDLLSGWTVSSDDEPIVHGQGIPQGPLPSGLLSE